VIVARPSWRSLPAGPELDAEVARRVYGKTGREVRSLINRNLLPRYSTNRNEAYRLLKDFDYMERGAGDPAVAPAMAQRFNKHLAERSADALAAGSYIRIALGCSKPINIVRAALIATEQPRRRRQG